MGWGNFAAAMSEGLFSLGGAHAQYLLNKRMLKHQYRYQEKLTKNQLPWMVAGAKEAGIHPLAAIGVQPMTWSPQTVGVDVQSAMSNMGQSIGRAVNSMLDKDARTLREIQLKQEISKAQNMDLQNQLLAKELANLDKPSVGPPAPSSSVSPADQQTNLYGQGDLNFELVKPQVPASQALGIRSGNEPLERVHIDSRGRTLTSPTDTEMLEDNLMNQAKYYARKIKDWAKGFGKYGQREAMLEIQRARPKAPNGYEFRYDPYTGEFVLHKKRNRDDSYFYHIDQTKYGRNVRIRNYPYWVTPLRKYR